jgi:hypothetical protein
VQRTVQELFTYSATDRSAAARRARATYHCPILNARCNKNNDDGAEANDPVLGGPLGVCSVFNPQAPGPSSVTCLCPARLYGRGYETLRVLARDVLGEPSLKTYLYGEWLLNGAPDGIVLVGRAEPGEIRTHAGALDWVAAVCRSGRLIKYAGIEAQAIDTTGNYRANRAALMREDRAVPLSGHGLNWENVNKRIIPQLLRKGVLLKQLATEHAVGLGFLVDANVFSKFETRLGGPLRDDHGFNLVVHAYSLCAKLPYESPRLVLARQVHASVDQLAERFLAPSENPESVARQIAGVLGIRTP